jgi:hypothetical protein
MRLWRGLGFAARGEEQEKEKRAVHRWDVGEGRRSVTEDCAKCARGRAAWAAESDLES